MSKYKLFYNQDAFSYIGDDDIEIGKVVDTETLTDAFYIFYNRNLYADAGYHMCMYSYTNEQGKVTPVAKVDDMYCDCILSEPDIFLCLMLHEYAHFINGDLDNTEKTNSMIQEERLQCILEDRIMEIEKNADIFALSHVGKQTFMRSMNFLIRNRRTRNDEAMHFAIHEFELRKKNAREIWESWGRKSPICNQ